MNRWRRPSGSWSQTFSRSWSDDRIAYIVYAIVVFIMAAILRPRAGINDVINTIPVAIGIARRYIYRLRDIYRSTTLIIAGNIDRMATRLNIVRYDHAAAHSPCSITDNCAQDSSGRSVQADCICGQGLKTVLVTLGFEHHIRASSTGTGRQIIIWDAAVDLTSAFWCVE